MMSVLSPLEIFLRLAAAVALGALLGFERTLARKKAGFRTYALVSLGSAVFVLVSQIVTALSLPVIGGVFDPLRVASQIVVGVGFLGAGLIIFRGDMLYGLTTAAGLWVSAAIGTAAGFGLYLLAIVGSLLTLFIFTALWFVERLISPPDQLEPH